MKVMKLKEVVSSTCDDSYEDIEIKSKYWPEARRFWYSEPYSNSKLAWWRKLKRRNSRVVEGRETMRGGQLFVGSVLQDSDARQYL